MPVTVKIVLVYFLMLLSLRSYSQSGTRAAKEELRKGKGYYDKYACRSCHGDKGVLQGDLTRAFEKYDDASMERYIRNPHQYKNFKMPVYEKVIPASVYPSLIAYIRFLGNEASKKK